MFVPIWIMAYLKFFCYVFYAQALACKKNNEMIEHVGSLVNKSFVGSVGCLDDCFESFLAHFLSHAVESVFEERSGV